MSATIGDIVPYGISAMGCCCSSLECSQFGCRLQRQCYQPAPYITPGCICPPTSEKTCQANCCPRKPSGLNLATSQARSRRQKARRV